MKKALLIILALSVLALTSCGPVAHVVADEIADAARLTLSAPVKKNVVVHVDNTPYQVKTVKAKPNQPAPTPQTIKQTSKNTVQVQAGQHNVQVTEKRSGREVYNNRVEVQQDEHRVINVDSGRGK
ncbi:MAG: hypothetical protein LUC24_01665 [Bacteroidales bacterium]|nr:hypothetical protein [Bacteroidales bacterium]